MKTKCKHTPGPWRVQEPSKPGSKDLALFRILTPEGINGVSICGSLADARLIAAAPELLEALKFLIRKKCVQDACFKEDLEVAFRAIAKADRNED